MSEPRSGIIRLADACTHLPGPAGEHSAKLMSRGTLDVRLAMRPPVSPTPSTPHSKDELYVVVRGRGILMHAGRRDAFQAGDLLYVAAGTEHCFADFSDDLAIWVAFYGPEGGEVPA